jgi:hypothetical protein
MLRLVQIARLHPHLQQHAATAVQLECFFLAHQLACHQRKQVGRFLERVFPLGIVAAMGQVALFDQIAVGQQHRIFFLVAAQHHGVFRHHVRAVGEPGDLAETFGLALGKEIAVGDIQTHHRGVFLGLDQCLDLQRDLVRRIGDAQFTACYRIAALVAFAERFAVHAQGHQLDAVAQQFHIPVGRCAVALHRDARGHTGCSGVEIETHFNGVHPVGRGSVVFAMDGDGRVLGHLRRVRK